MKVMAMCEAVKKYLFTISVYTGLSATLLLCCFDLVHISLHEQLS